MNYIARVTLHRHNNNKGNRGKRALLQASSLRLQLLQRTLRKTQHIILTRFAIIHAVYTSITRQEHNLKTIYLALISITPNPITISHHTSPTTHRLKGTANHLCKQGSKIIILTRSTVTQSPPLGLHVLSRVHHKLINNQQVKLQAVLVHG